jgi:hypothetical protein
VAVSRKKEKCRTVRKYFDGHGGVFVETFFLHVSYGNVLKRLAGTGGKWNFMEFSEEQDTVLRQIT